MSVDRPHVVMAVANSIAMDARVRKTATSVQAMGYRVTLLWADESGREVTEGDLDGVRTVGLPVPYHLRKRAAERRAKSVRERTSWLNPGYRDQAARRVKAAELAARRARSDSDSPSLALRGAALRHRIRSRALSLSVGARRRYLTARRRARPWTQELADTQDLDGIFTPWLIDLAPDVLHLHDIHLLSAGVHAKRRLTGRGRSVKLIYDAHEYIRGFGGVDPIRDAALAALEAELIKEADAVVTVSEPIADCLRRDLGLRERPTVVLNTPRLAASPSETPVAGVRDVVGLDAATPLAVYSGVLHHNRKLPHLIEAFGLLPEVHLALVCVPNAHYPVALGLGRQAAELGLAGRVHLVEPVAPEQVVEFLSSATLGIHPMALGLPNHEMALPNKLCDYIWAGLPVAVSQVEAMSPLVAEAGIGFTFDPEDPETVAGAIRRVLAERDVLAAAARSPELRERLSWEAQMGNLGAVYARLAPGGGRS